MIKTRLILEPGQPGTKRLVEPHGSKLVCVCYRYNERSGQGYKTIELIVKEPPYSPSKHEINSETIVGVRIGLQEGDLQRKVKPASRKWNRERRLWEVRYDRVVELGLDDRIKSEEQFTSRSFD